MKAVLMQRLHLSWDPRRRLRNGHVLTHRGERDGSKGHEYLQTALAGGSLRARMGQTCGYGNLEITDGERTDLEITENEFEALDTFSKFEIAYFKAYACGQMEDLPAHKQFLTN